MWRNIGIEEHERRSAVGSLISNVLEKVCFSLRILNTEVTRVTLLEVSHGLYRNGDQRWREPQAPEGVCPRDIAIKPTAIAPFLFLSSSRLESHCPLSQSSLLLPGKEIARQLPKSSNTLTFSAPAKQMMHEKIEQRKRPLLAIVLHDRT